MGKELIYLGVDGDYVRLALADLSDLTPRTVPVKRVPRTDFKRFCQECAVNVLGLKNPVTSVMGGSNR